MPAKKKIESATEKKSEKKSVKKKVAIKASVSKKTLVPKKRTKPIAQKPEILSTTKVPKSEGEKEVKKTTGSGKQKIRVIIRAFDHKIIDESAKTIIETAERTGSLVTGAIPLPTHISRVTLNRSTFVNKDAREQFEIRTHKRLIDITEYTGTTIESLSNLNLPSGVDVEIKML